ncbi:dynein regulatory complex subunit 3 [Gouania willdenowi]|uniref:Dynein regulatory complex subunit 3 n=1 Tax=Gouania willdenowi TaxID=441366 RepID=A0A8C5DQZ4_GOUWI|nr:dynein regulatory complex subunit 3 [Gouania willdenowi]
MKTKERSERIVSSELTEDLLQVAIEEAAEINAEPVPAHNEVIELTLENKNITWIDNLWRLPNLTRLELNNNLIKKIHGLDCLVNLKWLDLSFNSIVKIEGLESLEKLELLDLSDNRISVLENMETQRNLTHFLFENNLLEKLDMVLYLRKFKNLFDINLSRNPVTDEDNYRLYVAGHFPKLKYLDQRFLDENTKKEASMKYLYLLEKLREEELEKQEAAEAQQKQEAKLQLHKDAFVEFLNESHLFKSMFVDDPEAETLQCHPGIASLKKKFEDQMVVLCEQLFQLGLTELERRQTEESLFLREQSDILQDSNQRGLQTLHKFDEDQRKRIEELRQLTDSELIEMKIKQCHEEIDELCKSVMSVEFQRVTLTEENIRKLESSISEMVGNFSETAQGIFSQCRDLEDDYFGKVHEVAKATALQIFKDTLEEEMPDDVIMLFTDQQTVLDALTTGHDNHVTKMIDRETQLVTRITAWNAAFIKKIKEEELMRHRLNISDIQRYKDYLKEELLKIH